MSDHKLVDLCAQEVTSFLAGIKDTMSNANGKSEYTPLTLPTSGEVVLYRQVASMAMMSFRRQLQRQAPKPPVQATDLGPIPNPDHPSYIAAMKEWQEEQAFLFNAFLMAEGVIIEWTDEKKAKLEAARRRAMVSGIVLNPDDTMAYLEAIACVSNEDIGAIVRATTGQIPTREAIDETIATFQPNLEGNAAI